MSLDPQASAFLAAIAELDLPKYEDLPADQGREIFVSLTDIFGTAPKAAFQQEIEVPGGPKLRLYRAVGQGPQPCVMYFHGGGWVLGNIETHDALCRRISAQAGVTVVSVEYRPAPDDVFPAAINDCYTATRYVSDHASTLQIDQSRIAVAGDSAGGNLAAAVSLKARDEEAPPIHSQWLIYPITDANTETGSYHKFADGYGLTKNLMAWFWDQYVPNVEEREHPLASPLHAASLSGLPPTYLVSAGYDVLYDEGQAYAERLRHAGVPVTEQAHPTMLHGFLHTSEPFDEAVTAMSQLTSAMKGLFATQD
ncbi:MAG: alpha/beta hydrolase [Akkermansiaceae bacterium]|nr:alpha/beta hydrolase [Akkermansiaceae bacterium]